VSKKTYEHVYSVCKFPKTGLLCEAALEQASLEVGPHNVYDIYDNCPQTEAWLRNTNQSMRALLKFARARMVPGADLEALQATLGGGYEWSCDGMGAMERFFKRTDVQAALHLKRPGQSRFGYRQTGPASITLWPSLAKALRVLIYNGDSDACVPYKGNEEWTTGLAAAGTIIERKPWHPWFTPQTPNMPAGYATTYNVSGSSSDFSFVTVRLAGHMVPQYQPVSAFVFIDKFLRGSPF
jgi:serine carboxypeptidase-like clade 1